MEEPPMSTLASHTASPAGVQAWYTYCPVYHAGNVDAELGWINEEYKKLGARLDYFRSTRANDWWPHYRHNLENFFRFGGCAPAIHVRADLRPTKLLGLQWLYEGGAMIARSGDGIHRMEDLVGKRIGLSRSLNKRKNDWWRVTEERGIELMLKLHGMSHNDVVIVDMPYEDDWYSNPAMLEPLDRPSDLWIRRDIKNDKAFRPLEQALAEGKIDACYSADGMYLTQERSGKFKIIENLKNYPDWTLQVANCPYTLTVDAEFADKHPELVVAYMRGLIKVGRWCNANKRAAATFLHKVTFHPTEEDTAEAIAHLDFVPNLSAMNIAALNIEKDFMLKRGYIENDFPIADWMAPEFADAALKSLGN
jgi:ABC-type nitrate/sulfonate/bicarbonate transport system substrate-binding protein